LGGSTISNALSPELLTQLYGQESDDPFLMLVTLSHPNFVSTQYLVNNTANIVSNLITYTAFPMKITLPVDDGETIRQVKIDFDNVGRDLIYEIRSITTPISAKIDMILASNPDQVQVTLDGLSIRNISYDKSKISAALVLDDFLNTSMTSEQYSPSAYPGIF
jgi:hypothetical protein